MEKKKKKKCVHTYNNQCNTACTCFRFDCRRAPINIEPADQALHVVSKEWRPSRERKEAKTYTATNRTKLYTDVYFYSKYIPGTGEVLTLLELQVSFWGHTTQIPSSLSPIVPQKRDRSPKKRDDASRRRKKGLRILLGDTTTKKMRGTNRTYCSGYDEEGERKKKGVTTTKREEKWHIPGNTTKWHITQQNATNAWNWRGFGLSLLADPSSWCPFALCGGDIHEELVLSEHPTTPIGWDR